MDLLDPRSDLQDLQPGLVLSAQLPTDGASPQVRTDVSCFLRVKRSPEPLGEGAERLFIPKLPGSPAGDHCEFRLDLHRLTEWDESPFRGEFRTRQPALARQYLDNGGDTLHLMDVTFYVPPFDPSVLASTEDPDEVAELREEASLLRFYGWGLDRIDDLEGGVVSQIAVPDLWTAHVHLLPQVWAQVAEWCRATGNRFLVADSAPPLRLLVDEERKRARAEGVELRPDELTAAALVPWYRAEKWQRRDEIPVEVALTVDAVEAARNELRTREITLSCFAVYWPWVQNLRGLDIPPCGAICGVYARSDAENGPVGVMKSPANERVKAIFDLSLHVDEPPQNLLRREGINLLSPQTGKGIVVWGARTQCEEPIWRFVNVRRLIGYIGKQLELENQWSVFENNTEDLRQRVARDARYFLTDLWEKGALTGETPDEAFRVVCTTENNPDGVVERGILVVDVWVNPVQTSEFVHLQLSYGDALQD